MLPVAVGAPDGKVAWATRKNVVVAAIDTRQERSDMITEVEAVSAMLNVSRAVLSADAAGSAAVVVLIPAWAAVAPPVPMLIQTSP